ncbi:hypothetical protein WI58_17610 [Burkholderia cepacia]|nr:hypothetical protein WI49_07435 [Burkholderia cepacia]KVA69073.1 hypothetical protein WI48_29145 [Burkholderia cepacia]KVA83441.1 hypothetical protein WI50_18965 [Burkholderia cepacia]KVA95414.1 hypothetical protein WI52_34260 [Burkholderia cepacia]KVA96909.1 hypothetical protein WI51_33255 [Burkholderia cepacia]
MVLSIELTDVLTPQLLHQSRGRAAIGWCQQEVNVIVYKHAGMKKATRVQQRVAEQMQITLPVGIIEKADEAIVTSLHDVLRNAGQIESRKSGHEAGVVTRPRCRSRHGRADRVSDRHAVTPEVNLTLLLEWKVAGAKHSPMYVPGSSGVYIDYEPRLVLTIAYPLEGTVKPPTITHSNNGAGGAAPTLTEDGKGKPLDGGGVVRTCAVTGLSKKAADRLTLIAAYTPTLLQETLQTQCDIEASDAPFYYQR